MTWVRGATLVGIAAITLTNYSSAAAAPAPNGVRVVHARYGPSSAQTMTVYSPAARGPHPAILFIHGGCWSRGWATPIEEQFARTISVETGWTVASVNYRADGSRWATQPADIASALRRLQTGPYGVRADRTAVWGESAGGHLALLTAYRHINGVRPVLGAVSISGPTDMRTMSAAPVETLMNCISAFEQGKVSNPELAARYAATSPSMAVTTSSPATYLANSSADVIVPPDQALSLAGLLRRNQVPVQVDIVPGTHHASDLEPDANLPGGIAVRLRAEAFLRPYLSAR